MLRPQKTFEIRILEVTPEEKLAWKRLQDKVGTYFPGTKRARLAFDLMLTFFNDVQIIENYVYIKTHLAPYKINYEFGDYIRDFNNSINLQRFANDVIAEKVDMILKMRRGLI